LGYFRRGLVATLALLVLALASVSFAPSSGALTSDEQDLLNRTNALRASLGVPPLQIDPEAQALAEQWSQYMANGAGLVHPQDQYAGITTPIYWVGDDITQAYSVDDAWTRFTTSEVHRNNLIDPRYDYVGIGITVDGAGISWVQIKFMATTASLGQPEQPADDPATEPRAVTEDTTAPVEETAVPEVQVLSETLTKGVNSAVIPPIRYGAIGLPVADATSTSSSPWLALAIALGVGLLLLLAAALIVQSRKRAAKP
jgi:Cysteine-rich secretory protein family